MEPFEQDALARAIVAARAALESSQSELFEIERFLSEARTGGHHDWESLLVMRRDEKKQAVERLRSCLAKDEETFRKASAN